MLQRKGRLLSESDGSVQNPVDGEVHVEWNPARRNSDGHETRSIPIQLETILSRENISAFMFLRATQSPNSGWNHLNARDQMIIPVFQDLIGFCFHTT